MRLKTGYGPGKPNIWHALELSDEERIARYGRGRYAVSQNLVAGQYTAVEFEFEIGEQEIPAGGQLGIVWRWPFDWSDLQNDDANAAGFTSMLVKQMESSEISLSFNYDPYGGIEPVHHIIKIKVESGTLRRGERVAIVAGDQSGGCPGWRVQTCAAKEVGFWMMIDPGGDNQWTELVRQPMFSVYPGPPTQLVAIAPSDAVVGEPFQCTIRVEDRWGNATFPSSEPNLTCDALGDDLVVEEVARIDDPPAFHCKVRINRDGIHRIMATLDEIGQWSESNPVRVAQAKPSQQLFWGDLHSGQSLIGCGAGTLAEHYRFGRDAAGLHFITHQANDHYVTVDDWLETREVTKQFQEPGKYIAILGCEWSPATIAGGDRNVFYRQDEPRMRRSDRFFVEAEPDPEPDIPTAPEFHDAFRDEDVLVNIHVGGRMTNLDWYEPAIERLAEVHSTHGTVQWFVEDCLQRGYPVGVTAGTDGVMGRPGGCHPGSRLIRNVRNGLTAVCADELTLDSIWAALKARRCYGTTGERIILDVDVNNHPMGDEFATNDAPTINISVEGTAPIERIELRRGLDVIKTWQIAERRDASERQLRILWSGTAERGTARRQRVVWDGRLVFDGTEIIDYSPVGFQSPLDEISRESAEAISWKSITAGNSAGVALTLKSDGWQAAKFESGPSQFEFQRADVDNDLTIEAGGVGQRVKVGWEPKSDGPRHCEVNYIDDDKINGWCPYWVRVVQIDQEKAWSTPVYVTRTQ